MRRDSLYPAVIHKNDAVTVHTGSDLLRDEDKRRLNRKILKIIKKPLFSSPV